MKWKFSNHRSSIVRKSNVIALSKYGNNAETDKDSTTFADKLLMIFQSKNKVKTALDTKTDAIKIAESCVDILTKYHNQLSELHDRRRTKKFQYRSTAIGEVIDLLGSISDQTIIHTRQVTSKLILNKCIAERHTEHISTMGLIEDNKSQNLLTDVYDDFQKATQITTRNNKPLKRQLSRRTSLESSATGLYVRNARNSLNSDTRIANVTMNNNNYKTTFQTRVITNNYLELQTIISKLYQLETWDSINIFEVDELSQGNTLLIYLPIMMERFGFIGTNNINNINISTSDDSIESTSIKVDRRTLLDWINRVSNEGYHDLRYHSSIHAADVLQTVFYYVTRKDAQVLNLLTNEDIFALFIAACIHDYQHPGISHPYLIQSDHTSRYIYNDIDVLEHFHLSSCFQMMKKNNLDIFSQLTKPQRKRIKKYIVDSVLATNFGHQNELIFDMQNDFVISEKTENKTRNILRPLLMHASDISHCFKDIEIHKEWSERYFEEFFIEKQMLKSQGILSTGINRKDFSKEQVLFFELWCLPFYKIFYDWVNFSESNKIWLTGQKNYEYWKNGEKLKTNSII